MAINWQNISVPSGGTSKSSSSTTKRQAGAGFFDPLTAMLKGRQDRDARNYQNQTDNNTADITARIRGAQDPAALEAGGEFGREAIQANVGTMFNQAAVTGAIKDRKAGIESEDLSGGLTQGMNQMAESGTLQVPDTVNNRALSGENKIKINNQLRGVYDKAAVLTADQEQQEAAANQADLSNIQVKHQQAQQQLAANDREYQMASGMSPELTERAALIRQDGGFVKGISKDAMDPEGNWLGKVLNQWSNKTTIGAEVPKKIQSYIDKYSNRDKYPGLTRENIEENILLAIENSAGRHVSFGDAQGMNLGVLDREVDYQMQLYDEAQGTKARNSNARSAYESMVLQDQGALKVQQANRKAGFVRQNIQNL